MDLKQLIEQAATAINSGDLETCEKYCLQYFKEENESNTDQIHAIHARLVISALNIEKKSFAEASRMLLSVISDFPEEAEAHFLLGRLHLRTNKYDEAINYFRKAIELKPNYLNYYFGYLSALSNANRTVEGANACREVLKFEKNNASIRSSFGNFLLALGHVEEARTQFLKVLELKPNFDKGFLNLGKLYETINTPSLAIHYYLKYIKINPIAIHIYIKLANLYFNEELYERAMTMYHKARVLGNLTIENRERLASCYFALGYTELSITAFKSILEDEPDTPNVYFNIGMGNFKKGDTNEAERYVLLNIEKFPDHDASYYNLGLIRQIKGSLESAEQCFMKALAMSDSHYKLAEIYHTRKDYQIAYIHCRNAITLNPTGKADYYKLLGKLCYDMENFQESRDNFLKCTELDPSNAEAVYRLGDIYKIHGHYDEALVYYRTALNLNPSWNRCFSDLCHTLQCVCDWEDQGPREERLMNIVLNELQSNALPSVHSHHAILYPFSNETRLDIAKAYANYYLNAVQGILSNPYSYAESERLKIGYISYDFRNHSTSYLMQSIPGLHDRKLVQVYCYSLSKLQLGDKYTEKISTECDYFINLSSLSIKDSADRINSDGINILIDLNGYTAGARTEIFALKPAPIQVMWLAYPSTSGSTFMDYFITDKVTSPLHCENEYSEKLAYMPDTFFIGDHKQVFPYISNRIDYSCNSVTNIIPYHTFLEVKKSLNESSTDIDPSIQHDQNTIKYITSRSTFQLPLNAVVYCSFNQLYKLDPSTMKMWVNILKAVPNSVLWLLRYPPAGEKYIIKYVESLGFAKERIIFADFTNLNLHICRGQLADICLDTVLCNGHTTSMNMLWSGIPIVTMPGKTHASRITSSLLTTLGCPELIASSCEEYEKLAILLGLDSDYRDSIRTKIWHARTSSPLFDCSVFTKNLEKLYLKMWDIYKTENTPRHIFTLKD